jgi:hypothetical protein
MSARGRRLLESAPAAIVDFVRETMNSLVLDEHPTADDFTISVASILTTDDRQILDDPGP